MDALLGSDGAALRAQHAPAALAPARADLSAGLIGHRGAGPADCAQVGVPVASEADDRANTTAAPTGILSGAPVDHRGRYFTASAVRFLPPPVNGAIPIWVTARWPNRRPLRRAARYDGLFVIDIEPPALRTALQFVEPLRPSASDPYEVVVHADAEADPRPWRDAGATWWLAAFDPFTVTPSAVQRVIDRGPAV